MKAKTPFLLVLSCLVTVNTFARPPKVVKMFPENGATDVKPGPTKIRILFDQDMSSGGYSLCGGGENYPEIVGKPQWAGKRAFVFKANLKPNHDYIFGINSPSFKNFKSASGEPAEVLVVQFHTAGANGETSSETPAISTHPPKVIKMFPENGSTDVKPGPTEIRIQFDQDMSSDGYSVCGSGENFPKIVGKPQWAGKRDFVFKANLKPNHAYRFWINSQSFKNFKSASGEPAEVLAVQFRTTGADGQSSANTPTNTKEDNQQAISELRQAIENHYSYNDIKNLDWNALFAKYNESLLNATDPMDFAKTAGLLLAHTKDKHIWLMVDEQFVPAYRNPVAPNANLPLLPKLIPNFKKHNNNICTGKFPDGVGYIYIDSWNRQQKEDFDALYIALNEFADASGLIIDVRGNGGGSEPLAREFAGCFVDSPKVYAKHVIRDTNATGGFTEPHERVLNPNKTRPQYRGKVAVLTGPVVMSSCEAFVLMMKQVPNCILVGEPTQGSSGNPQTYDLGNGVIVYLPCWKAMLPDGTCFEGKGIQPDILIKVRPEQITTADPVIEAARKALTKK